MSEDFNWENNGNRYLLPYTFEDDDIYYFKVEKAAEKDHFLTSEPNTRIWLLNDKTREDVVILISSSADVDTSKKSVEKTIEHINSLKRGYSFNYMKDYIIEQLPLQTIIYHEQPESLQKAIPSQSPASDRQLETAQKTGYVQGVCESILAFNNDENRKIMSEATMSFLSKKLLSEMKVTKDMAQKFASPETYKALEQSVFAPKQEQKLEQTQSQGFKR